MLLIALAVLFFDQGGKYFAINNIGGFSLYKNFDIPLGIPFYFHLIFLFILIVALFSKREDILKNDNVIIVAFSLLIGGFLSNSLDRFVYGFVIDYLQFFNLFVFNFADVVIFFGLFFLGWKIFRK